MNFTVQGLVPLSRQHGYENGGEVRDSTGAVRWCRDNHADVALLDIGFPVMSGLEAAKITRYTSETKVIILTDEHSLISPYKVMNSGAAGYLYQSSDREDLLHAIRIISGASAMWHRISPSRPFLTPACMHMTAIRWIN